MIAGPLFFVPKSVKADGHGIYPSDIYMTTKSDHGLLKVTKEEVKNSKKDTLNITFTLDSVADLDTKEKLTGIKFNGDANADTFYATTSHTSNGGYLDNVKAVIVHDVKDQCTYTIQWGSWDDCEFDDGTADMPKSGTEWKTGEAKTASLSVDYSLIEPIQEYADGTDDATKTFTLSIIPHFELSYNNDFSLTSHDTTSIKELQVQVMVFKDAATRDADTTKDPGETTGNSTGTGGGGSTLADILNRILTYYILAHVRIIYWAFSNVVAPLIESLLQVHPYQDVFVEAIYLGWQLIRNLCNIFFIVILLVIGLGTLFRLESYNYKHLLVKVVIAALLVNFSLVFGQAVLGVADTVQQQFLPDSTNVIRALGSKLMVEPINKLTDSSNFSTGSATTAGASFANLTKPIFALALALGAFFTFLALAAFLVIRIVALWILLLVSPLAYVANILPQTASYGRSWWTHFLKYAFMTPVLAFFLNLSAVFVTTMIRDQATFSQLLHTQKVSGEIAQFVYLAGSQILTILFILVGLKAASSSGTYGGQAIANFAEKGMRKPFEWYGKAAKAGANRGLEGLSNKTGIELDPRIWKKDISKRMAERKNERLIKRKSQGGAWANPTLAYDNVMTLSGLRRLANRGRYGSYESNKHEENEAMNQIKMLRAHKDLPGLEQKEANLTQQANNLGTKQALLEQGLQRMIKNKASQAVIDIRQAEIDKVKTEKARKEAEASKTQGEIDTLRREAKITGPVTKAQQAAAAKAFTDGTVQRLEEKAQRAREISAMVKPLANYEAKTAEQHAIAEAGKKFSHEDNEEILREYLLGAEQRGDQFEARALVEKLAKDGNFNELLMERYGNTDFASQHKFYTDFAKKMKMTSHQMAEFASEVGYINERINFWSMARATKVDDHGHLKLFDPNNSKDMDERSKTIWVQMSKADPQKIARDYGRFAYGSEHKDPKTGKVVRILDEHGKMLFQKTMNTPQNLIHVSGRMQPYSQSSVLEQIENVAAQSGYSDINKFLRDNGMPKELITALKGELKK